MLHKMSPQLLQDREKRWRGEKRERRGRKRELGRKKKRGESEREIFANVCFDLQLVGTEVTSVYSQTPDSGVNEQVRVVAE